MPRLMNTNNLLLTSSPSHRVSEFGIEPSVKNGLSDKEFVVSITKKLIEASKEDLRRKAALPKKEIFLKGDSAYFRLDIKKVAYFEAFGNYIKVHYLDGAWVIANCTIKSIEEQLPQNVFCRVHRSFIVKMHSVDNFTAQNLQVKDRIIPIGRNFKSSFERRMIKL